MPRTVAKRRVSFAVAVVRDRDGSKRFETRCNRCRKYMAVAEMTGHANRHFTDQDIRDSDTKLARQREKEQQDGTR